MKRRFLLLAVIAGFIVGSASFAFAQSGGDSEAGDGMVVAPGYGVLQADDCPEATELIRDAGLNVDNYTTPGGACPDLDELEQALQEVADARSDDWEEGGQ